MIQTEILKIKGDWPEVLDDCRATVKKPARGKEPRKAWKEAMLIAEHDPIRDIEVKFRWPSIPYWVAMHFKTHIWRSRTNSQRNDRQSDYDRNAARQDAPVEFIGDCNAQHLIDTSRKRLCYLAAPETRKAWESLKASLDASIYSELSFVMVPNCVYRAGCPEASSCGFYRKLVNDIPGCGSPDIKARYAAYNYYFYGYGRALDD